MKKLSLIFVAVILVIVAGYFIWTNKSPKTERTSPPIMGTTQTSELKSYQNTKYGFEIKYPSNFVSAVNPHGEEGLIQISDKNNFDNNESALLISLNIDKDSGLKDGSTEKAENDFNIKNIEQKLNVKIVSRFAGDPPWGYYNVAIPLKSDGKWINFNIRIPQSDLPQYGGKNLDLEISKNILSSFEFIK